MPVSVPKKRSSARKPNKPSKSSKSNKNLKDPRIITLEEFEKHDKISDCWIQIEDKIFDVSSFMHQHPGGIKVMLSLAGKDATFPFQMNHKAKIWYKYLSLYFIGYLESSAVNDIYKDRTYSPAPDVIMHGYKPIIYKEYEDRSRLYFPKNTKFVISDDKDNNIDIDDSNDSDDKKLRLNENDTEILRDYRKLWKELFDGGYWNVNYSYYYMKSISYLILFLSVIIGFHLSNLNNSILLGCVSAFGLGMFFQQIAFIGHDLGHNGITQNPFWDGTIGIFLGNFIGGASIGWWKYTHNVHHIRTNDLEFDPDIQHLPVFAITSKYLGNIYSKFHDRIMKYDFIAKKLIRYQHLLFLPILFLARVNLHIQSFIFLVFTSSKNPKQKLSYGKYHRLIEGLAIIGYLLWSIPLFYNTNFPILYWFITQTTAGVLHLQIVLNHFPCPVFNDLHPNFFIHQIQSSMDITTNRFTDWFGGGLQYQVEHHLFPNMPRHNLRRIKPIIKELCKKHGLNYQENTFMGATKDIYYILKNVAETSKDFHLHLSDFY